MNSRSASPSYRPSAPRARPQRRLLVVAGLAVAAIILAVLLALFLDGLTNKGPVSAERAELETISVPSETARPPRLAIVSKIDATSPWARNAERFAVRNTKPRLGIVILDDGSDAGAALTAMRLPVPVTMAIAPTADAADKRADAARRFGREVLLLLPMQAEETFDTAPNPIALHVPRDELLRRIDWNLAQIDNYVGVINQHGEAASRDPETMRIVMEKLRDTGLGYIDGRTHEDSVAGAVARRMGIPTGDITNSVVSDVDTDALRAELDAAVQRAQRWGTALIAIPAGRTQIAALQKWLEADREAVEIAPVTAVVAWLRSGKGS